MPDSDGVVGTSGVSSEESAGELPGKVAEVVGPLAALHWLTGGVCTLQAPGRATARVWFTVIPNNAPLPLSTKQRH